ncbi:unnamed protein product, partial [Durusdinium trenchii]
ILSGIDSQRYADGNRQELPDYVMTLMRGAFWMLMKAHHAASYPPDHVTALVCSSLMVEPGLVVVACRALRDEQDAAIRNYMVNLDFADSRR